MVYGKSTTMVDLVTRLDGSLATFVDAPIGNFYASRALVARCRVPFTMSAAAPPVRVAIDGPTGAVDEIFTKPFQIGRGADCEVRIRSDVVSRVHARVTYEDGAWWVTDAGSRNGIYQAGTRVTRTAISGSVELRLATNGPVVRLRLGDDRTEQRSPPPRAAHAASVPPARATHAAPPPPRTSQMRVDVTQSEATAPPKRPRRAPPSEAARQEARRDMEHYIQHYLSEAQQSGGPAGERTMMIRRAFQAVQQKQRRRWGTVLAVLAVGAVGLGGFVIVQRWRHASERAAMEKTVARQRAELDKQRASASQIFDEIRGMEVQIAQLGMLVEQQGGADLQKQLASLEESRNRLRRRYDGYVEELGLRRRLKPEEQAIYRVALAFNESEFGMPAEFVERTLETIHGYWQTPAGRGRFERALRRAGEYGYAQEIVQALARHGLPPQFFYLALQESDFDVKAIGPPTRWGRAKGMWQFIPPTATRFGLNPGPFADEGRLDILDERHDFAKSTEAAARYLRTIYATLAQASGLLVVASYNWGEHRIAGKLEELTGPQTIPADALTDVPENPMDRSYWRFLGQYSDRMPEETKNYVLRIFAAAVMGEDPRLFGFDLDNPLAAYADGGRHASASDAVSARPTPPAPFRRAGT